MSFFSPKPPKFPLQTFTYYVPAPPDRGTGYREKEFDRLFSQFMEQGFELEDLKTVSQSGTSASGTAAALNVAMPPSPSSTAPSWTTSAEKRVAESAACPARSFFRKCKRHFKTNLRLPQNI